MSTNTIPRQRRSVVDRVAARVAVTPWATGWQQWHDPLPQRVRDKIFNHAGL